MVFCESAFWPGETEWIRDLDRRAETLNLLQYETGETLEEIGRGKNFLNRFSLAQEITPIIKN